MKILALPNNVMEINELIYFFVIANRISAERHLLIQCGEGSAHLSTAETTHDQAPRHVECLSY